MDEIATSESLPLRAVGRWLLILGGAMAWLAGCSTEHDSKAGSTGATSSMLTAEQCRFFASGEGRVRLCHRTDSKRKPYAVVVTSVAGCDDHAGHPGDYVAEGDPTCSGQGCFPLDAPWDGTVECCEGLAPRDGYCKDIDACADHPCGAHSSCTDLPAPAPDTDSGRSCSCDSGFADCNGDGSDGCEVDLGTDRANCGACGASCAGSCAAGVCVDSCGDGYCSGAESCESCAHDCGTCGSPYCDGSGSSWAACRGSGCTVCVERLDLAVYPRYLTNHPSCLINNGCLGEFYACSSHCPAPTDADR